MLSLDISQLVRSALHENGFDKSVISDIDNHSTIELGLNNLPSIYIEQQEEEVLLWSNLCDTNSYLFEQRSANLLRELMASVSFAKGGHLILCEHGNGIVLKCMVQSTYLESGAKFFEALTGYFERMENFHEALK